MAETPYHDEVSILNLDSLLAAMASLETALREKQEIIHEELKRIRLGTGLVTGVDLSEEDTE